MTNTTMITDAPTPAARTGRTGSRVEVGRYTLPSGVERILYAQRILGCVRVSDHPAAKHGRRYIIERGLEQEGQNAHAALRALVADYIDQAARGRAIPIFRG